MRGDEVASLGITTEIIITLVNLLALCETHMHIIELSSEVPSVLDPRELSSESYVIRALILALHIKRTRQAYKHLVHLKISR